MLTMSPEPLSSTVSDAEMAGYLTFDRPDGDIQPFRAMCDDGEQCVERAIGPALIAKSLRRVLENMFTMGSALLE